MKPEPALSENPVGKSHAGGGIRSSLLHSGAVSPPYTFITKPAKRVDWKCSNAFAASTSRPCSASASTSVWTRPSMNPGLEVLLRQRIDVHAEGELCVRMLVLLVVDVPHKGWHHLWVPQAHLVANEPELGSDLYEGLHLRIRVFFVFFFHWGGPCFHSEHIGRVDRFYCNLVPFLDGNHCDLLLLGLLLRGTPGRVHVHGRSNHKECDGDFCLHHS